MLRVGTFVLLSAMLFSSKPVLQLIKLPKLFQHYSEHVQHNPDISFLDFLSMHYWGHDANDGDDDKDRQLPFKENMAFSAHYDVAITFPPVDLSLPAEFSQFAYNTAYRESFITRYTGSLFHPPKPH